MSYGCTWAGGPPSSFHGAFDRTTGGSADNCVVVSGGTGAPDSFAPALIVTSGY